MMEIQNGIPLAAVILESLMGLFMLSLAIRSVIRYRQKQSKVTFYLMFGLFSYALAAIISGITKYRDYTSDISRDIVSYSTQGIIIAYCLMTLSNIFFALLLTELFLKKDNQFPFIIGIANFIIIGLLLPNAQPIDGAYEQVLNYLVIFILLTMILHGTLAFNAIKESKGTDIRLTKVGFRMIGGFSILVISALLFFISDLVFGVATSSSYTIFYYIGWSTVGLATLIGFLGYIMPGWFRQLVQPSGL